MTREEALTNGVDGRIVNPDIVIRSWPRYGNRVRNLRCSSMR